MACEQAGADGITVHLRGDRRHIQDQDVRILREVVTTYLNLEMAATEEMLKVALETKPDAVTLVAEKPDEITTEGGLDVKTNISIVRAAVARLRQGNVLASLFIDPDPAQIEVAHEIGAQQVELCTSAYAEATLGARGIHGEGSARAAQELRRLREGAALATQYGLHVAAGHGLTYRNVGAVAGITEISEFNIGHNIVARAIFVGMGNAVEEMRWAIKAGGGPKG
jgi:pyridoxine 5-phosphate synthase